MFENVFIVAKNMLRRTIWRSKSRSLIHSAILPLVIYISFLLWPTTFSMTRRLLLSITDLIFSFRAWHNGTLGKIIAIRRLTQLTQLTDARINCALKDLSCDSPLSKILKLTILASNASSSSTKVLKCPHARNDSIITHNGSTIYSSGITINTHTHTHKDEHNA
ncbi:hypothetical protein H5410_030398 [Solanum commersonii]|uniref:Uncharacterized protein n=1 Tax=Solanum commersonii TaxID=4109 RepID=A0A9J5YIJ9_SOLCO|nr:hypothetical protein H5410_030398 [Solanum commersonii]